MTFEKFGYPIWWGNAAWPVNGFINVNDFTDKTVIPFCTAGTSGFGRSGEILEEMAGTGNWMEGKKLASSLSGDTLSEDEAVEWINGLNLGIAFK